MICIAHKQHPHPRWFPSMKNLYKLQHYQPTSLDVTSNKSQAASERVLFSLLSTITHGVCLLEVIK